MAQLTTLLAGAARWLGMEPGRLRPLSGDVSPRQYARVALEDGSSRIVAAYPDEIRSVCRRFLETTALLTTAGVRCPRVDRADEELGLVLLEDVGPTTLFEAVGDEGSNEVDAALERATAIIDSLLGLDADVVGRLNPDLGGDRLRRELEQTWTLFLHPHGLVGGGATTRRLEAALDDLCHALEQPGLVPCHRDFMARNLVPTPTELAVLDHQDLCLGPIGYDLASLLNDSLFASRELERRTLDRLHPDLRLAYRRSVVQRTLKAIGTYCKFAQLGSNRYLSLVPPTLGRALRHWSAVPELRPLATDLGSSWGQAAAKVW